MQVEALSLRGRLVRNASLAEYNSWRVGGCADILYIPADLNDLSHFLQQLPKDIPVFWLGLGSNVLIRDGGVEGAVIVTQGALMNMSIQELDGLVRAEAGVSCAQVARHTARHGLTGLEFMAGIPGTVGGALAMNAGCYGGETWQWTQHVEVMNRAGERELRPVSEFEIGYRHVKRPPEEWFIAGHFKLLPGEKTHSLENIRVLLEKRNASQPTGLPNCGSVFRNPPGQYAAKLIELSGLKGTTIGGASVSHKHANFIINDGGATANDIETLIYHIITTVMQEHDVSLIPEVCFIGRPITR
jgi:UDP-N-acetylmuramate dehydrogenase